MYATDNFVKPTLYFYCDKHIHLSLGAESELRSELTKRGHTVLCLKESDTHKIS